MSKEMTQAETPAPEPHLRGVQELLHALDRGKIAQIIDPTAWKNEGGDMIEQTHSGPALLAADQVITYVLRTARALASEGRAE